MLRVDLSSILTLIHKAMGSLTHVWTQDGVEFENIQASTKNEKTRRLQSTASVTEIAK
jgi:hypothetical protein